MNKISPMQLMTLLICSKLFCIMTYIPEKDENGALFIITELIAFAVLALLLIPSIAFYNKNKGEGILSIVGTKSRTLSVLLSIFYLIVCLFAVIRTTGDISFFMQYCFSDIYTPWTVIIVICAAAFYIAQHPLPTLARITGIVVVLTIIGLVLVLFGFEHHIDIIELNIAVENKSELMSKSIQRILANSYEMIAFVLLLGTLKKQPARSAYSYLTIKTIMVCITILVVTVVLGDYVHLSKLPFFSLSVFSKTKIIEHFEAFFMLFWTLCAIIKITLFTKCANLCISQIFPSHKHHTIGNLSVLTISAAITIPLLTLEKWEKIKLFNVQSAAIIIGMFVIPLICLMFKGRHANLKEA